MKSSFNVYTHKYGTFITWRQIITCQLKADDQCKNACEYFAHRDRHLPVTLRYLGQCRHFSWSNSECMSPAVKKEVKLLERIDLI